MMNKIILTSVAALGLVTGAQAQSSQYGTVEDFYQANTEIDTGQYAGRAVNPAYWLVDWNSWTEIDSRWINGGYVRLGVSNWACHNPNGGGVPLKDWAMAYAKAIGADVVVYAALARNTDSYNYSCSHMVGFYAKAGVREAGSTRPSGAWAKAALNRFQDAHGRPRVQSDVVYDPRTDTYTWIGPVTGKRITKTSGVFLSDIGL
jgi:hypothetical protein